MTSYCRSNNTWSRLNDADLVSELSAPNHDTHFSQLLAWLYDDDNYYRGKNLWMSSCVLCVKEWRLKITTYKTDSATIAVSMWTMDQRTIWWSQRFRWSIRSVVYILRPRVRIRKGLEVENPQHFFISLRSSQFLLFLSTVHHLFDHGVSTLTKHSVSSLWR